MSDEMLPAVKALITQMKEDPEYAWSWHYNIAMPIMDMLHCTHEEANSTAAHLMQHLFDIDIRSHPHYPVYKGS